jgi:hypothetical protein
MKRDDMRRAEATPEPRLPRKGAIINPGKSLEAEEESLAALGEAVGLDAPASQVSVWIVMTPFPLVMDGCSLAPTILR